MTAGAATVVELAHGVGRIFPLAARPVATTQTEIKPSNLGARRCRQQPSLSVHISWQQPMLTLSLSVSLPKLAKSAWQPGSCQLFCLQLAQERAGALMRKGCEKKGTGENKKGPSGVHPP